MLGIKEIARIENVKGFKRNRILYMLPELLIEMIFTFNQKYRLIPVIALDLNVCHQVKGFLNG